MINRKPQSIAEAVAGQMRDNTRIATVIAVNGNTVDIQVSGGAVFRALYGLANANVGDQTTIEFKGGVVRFVGAGSSAGTSGSLVGGTGGSSTGGLPRDGTQSMLGNLNMGGYSITNVNLVDGVDLGGADPFPQYLTTAEASLLYAPITRQIIAGAGMTQDYTTLANDITLAVGVANTGATGLTVEADTVRLTSSSNPGAAASVLASDGAGYLQLKRIGLNTAPSYAIHAVDTAGTQMRLAYDTDSYVDMWVGGGDIFTLTTTGMWVWNIGGNNAIVPNLNWSIDLGLPTRKFRSFRVGEFEADVLVIREKVVSSGGRLVICPCGELISDFPASA